MKQYVKTFESFKTDVYKRLNEEEDTSKNEYGNANTTFTAYVQTMFDITNGFTFDEKYNVYKLNSFKRVYTPDMNTITIGFVKKLAGIFKENPKHLFSYIMLRVFRYNGVSPTTTDTVNPLSVSFGYIWKNVAKMDPLILGDIKLNHFNPDVFIEGNYETLWDLLMSEHKFRYFKKYDQYSDESKVNREMKNRFDEYNKLWKGPGAGSFVLRHMGKTYDEVVTNLGILHNSNRGNLQEISRFFDKLGKFKDETIEYFASGIFKEKDTKDTEDTAKK